MSQLLQQIEGKYEILSKLGEGGMGAVYQVRHRLLEETRVIKLLRPQHAGDERLQERFLHEARMAIRLRHPNVAQLYDFSIDERGTAYIVMEYIDGVTAEDVLRRDRRPSVGLALEIARQGLSALAYLHQQGFVHRDVSPDNLMLTRSFDGSALVKLIDLGIAKRLDAEVGLTRTGTFMGKVRYSSPEQFAEGGAAVLDQRSDLYSFGVLLYELLTGTSPIRGDDLSQLVASHLFHPPLDFAESDPEGRVPEELRALILRTLEKDPADRIATADELARSLAGFDDPECDLAAELDEVLRTVVHEPAAEDRHPEPGSTQDRLDRQFGKGETPAAAPSTSVQGAGSPSGGTGSGSGGAPAKSPGGAIDTSRVRIEKRVEALRAEVQEAAEKRHRRPSSRAENSPEAQRIERLIRARGLDDALAALDSIAREGGESTQLGAMRADVAAASARVAEIGRLIDDGETEQASERLAEARRDLGDLPELDELALRLGEEPSSGDRRASDAQAAEAIDAIRHQLDAGARDTALRMLEFARARYGGHPEFDRLEESLG